MYSPRRLEMARNYVGIPVKKNWVYSVEDLMRLFGVSQNTVSSG